MLDPLTLSIVRHKLQTVAEEMVETMTHTCFSPILNLNQDFSSVVLDGKAQILAQAERVPIHMAAMPRAIIAMMEAFKGDIGPEDVIMANDPYYGGSHLPDITLAKPIFRDGEIQLWVSLRAHQGDIGGISAGGYSPEATEIWHEGIRIPPIKLVDAGRMREDVLRLVFANSRKPADLRGDVMAQLSAVTIGAKRLEELLDRYGTAVIAQSGAAILDAGEATMRTQIAGLKPGRYEGVSHLETNIPGETIPITAKVEIRDGRAIVDLTDCPPQHPSFLNSPIANTVSAVVVAFLYMVGEDQSLNSGSERLIEVRTREGSIVDPVLPAAVVACTSLTAAAIIEAVLRAMAEAAPEKAIGGFARRFRFALSGRTRDEQSYIWHFFFNRGGSGGNMNGDGWPNLGGVHNPGGTPAPSVEQTESSYPLFVTEYALRVNSGGQGRKRGGLGGSIRMRYEGAAPAVLNLAGDGENVAPYGIAGGEEGMGHAYELVRAGGETVKLGGRDAGVVVNTGDTIVCLSAGGGGFGPKQERDPAEHARDLKYGYVTE